MKIYKFLSDSDVVSYINQLIEEKYNFHLDDDPEDCLSGIATEEDLKNIKLNHAAMWNYCNPWEVLEKFPKLLNRYLGN